MRVTVLGVQFDDTTVEQAASRSIELMQSGGKAYVVTPNPEIVWLCRRNEALRAAINSAALVLPDGIGVILGARILGSPLRGGRVPGIEFAAALLEKMAESGGSVFLLGAKPGIAEEAGLRLAEKHKGLVIAGTADGYFSDDGPVVDRINAVCPDLVLVCLGSPRQELWMSENFGRLNTSLCAGLGGSLDVFAGKAKRAPAFFRKLGLEWFYRLLREPRRIKRMIKLPLFVLAVAYKRIRG
jgi:N-acetylglucosaminyldiphosphoundecaprenol N-acetyl-beta-D-mannosaminyltransferase